MTTAWSLDKTNPRKIRYAKVAVPSPQFLLFDYLVPDDLTGISPGNFVSIPFGKSWREGMIVEINNYSDYSFNKLKPINRILSHYPKIDEARLQLFRFAYDYFHYPPGELLKNLLPTMARKKTKKKTIGG